jgi:hypothetical protein
MHRILSVVDILFSLHMDLTNLERVLDKMLYEDDNSNVPQ